MERLADAYASTTDERDGLASFRSPDGYAFDLLGIATVAVILVLAIQTRPSFQKHLVLHYDKPSLHAFYTTHFVHSSASHLWNNLTSYLVVVPLTYLISLRADRHCEFRPGFLAILFVLPPILSLVNFLGLDLVIQTTTILGTIVDPAWALLEMYVFLGVFAGFWGMDSYSNRRRNSAGFHDLVHGFYNSLVVGMVIGTTFLLSV